MPNQIRPNLNPEKCSLFLNPLLRNIRGNENSFLSLGEKFTISVKNPLSKRLGDNCSNKEVSALEVNSSYRTPS